MDAATCKSRRQFLEQLSGYGGAALLAPAISVQGELTALRDKPAKGFTFLFQGDSITDGNRSRNNDWNHVMGHGYQYIIASKWWYDNPGSDFHFFNRGVSGNKVSDLAARWEADTLAIKPNLLSILVGINDVSAWINGDRECTADRFESGYRELLQRTRANLPGIRLVLCDPFVLPVGHISDKYDQYREAVRQRQDIVRQLAAAYHAIYVPFQEAFDAALEKAPAEYWIWDGIHPMPAGHELMAIAWMKKVGRTLGLGH